MRDGTAELVACETNFFDENGDRGKNIFPAQLTTSRIGNLTRLMPFRLTGPICQESAPPSSSSMAGLALTAPAGLP